MQIIKKFKNFKKSIDKKLLFVYNIFIPNKYSLKNLKWGL